MPSVLRILIIYPLLAILGLAAVAVAIVAIIIALAYPNLPSLDVLTDYHPKIPMRIYTADGFLMGEFGEERRAVVAIDADKAQAMLKLREKLAILLAKGCCKNIGREDVHALVDEIFDEYRR